MLGFGVFTVCVDRYLHVYGLCVFGFLPPFPCACGAHACGLGVACLPRGALIVCGTCLRQPRSSARVQVNLSRAWQWGAWPIPWVLFNARMPGVCPVCGVGDSAWGCRLRLPFIGVWVLCQLATVRALLTFVDVFFIGLCHAQHIVSGGYDFSASHFVQLGD